MESFGKNIFIVDDDPVIRLLVSEYLKNQGYAVCALDSAKACIEKLTDQMPDLIFVDMQMPEMNGAELLQILRNTPAFSGLPVIICSAGNDVEDYTRRNFNVSANEYLSKPFDIKSLSGVIERVFSS
jgi:two-component system sensor histidine kinase ChiS